MTFRRIYNSIKKTIAIDPYGRLTFFQDELLCLLSLIITVLSFGYISFFLLVFTGFHFNKHHYYLYLSLFLLFILYLIRYLRKIFSKNKGNQSVNDPSIVEDGWQAGSDTIYRKILHRLLAVIAVQIGLPIILWTSYLIYYSILWNCMLDDYREKGMPTTISEALPPPVSESMNVMASIANSEINLSSSLGMNFKDYSNKHGLGSVYNYLTNCYDEQKRQLPNNLSSLSRTDIRPYFIKAVSIPAIKRFVNDLEQSLEKPELDVYKTDRTSDFDIPEYDVNILQHTNLLRYYALSELLSGREENAVITLRILCAFINRYALSSKDFIGKYISRISYLDSLAIINSVSGKISNRLNMIILMNTLNEISYETLSLEMIRAYQLECCRYVKYYNDPEVYYDSSLGNSTIDRSFLFLLKPWFYKYGYHELEYLSELKNIIESNNPQNALLKIETLKNSPQYRPLSKYGIPRSLSTDFIFSFHYLESQNRMTTIGLALRIYKMNHGHFPETLDMLSPDILNKIPLDPINGLDYKYSNIKKIIRLEGSKISFIKRDEKMWNTELIIK